MKQAIHYLFVIASLAFGTSAGAVGVPGQGTWESTLQARDINNDGTTDAFYDTELNITWIRDGNMNGPMTFADANSWANGLVIYGKTGWRLPTMIDFGAPGCDFAVTDTDCGYNVRAKVDNVVYSELGHLYGITLGNKGYASTTGLFQPDFGLSNTADFINLQAASYWTNKLDPTQAQGAWQFEFGTGTTTGSQFPKCDCSEFYAIAVTPGDVAAVPEPSTALLLIAGLSLIMVPIRRRA